MRAYPCDFDSLDPTNKDCARWAEQALKYYVVDQKRETYGEADRVADLNNLMVDLLHYHATLRSDVKAADILRQALEHFEVEHCGEGI